jgi:hypothetical protein
MEYSRMTTIAAHTGPARIGAVAESFAADISRRIAAAGKTTGVQKPGTEIPDDQAAHEEKLSRLGKLESALGGTVSYMAAAHGEKAASAMIGLIYKRLGDGEVNEQTLGEAFLDVTRFIDAAFGTDKGDAFMAHLNGNLNTSMNAFFDNGLNESFMVAPAGGNSGTSGGAGVEGLLAQVSEQYAESIKKMLEEARAKEPDAASPIAAYEQFRHSALPKGAVKDLTA